MINQNIIIYSLNVNGLPDNNKRKAIFNTLHKLEKGIILLQETHSCKEMESIWHNQWGNNNIIFSHGETNSRGVAILIANDIEHKITKCLTDNNGRYIVLDLEIGGASCTIINLYAPMQYFERNQIQVINELHENLQNFSMENVIWGGDFNMYLNPEIDRIETVKENMSLNYREELVTILEIENLVDIWRTQNKSKPCFTWQRGHQRSRLDYIFISEHLLNRKIQTKIQPIALSDHCLLTVNLEIHPVHKAGRGFWKFNASMLNDPVYVTEIKQIIKNTGNEISYLDDKNMLWEIIKLEIRNFSIPYSIKKKRCQNTEMEQLNARFNELFALIPDNLINDELV